MKRKQVIKHLEGIVCDSDGLTPSIALKHKDTGSVIDIDGELAIWLIAATLVYAIEQLESDRQKPSADSSVEALAEIIKNALHGYALDL